MFSLVRVITFGGSRRIRVITRKSILFVTLCSLCLAVSGCDQIQKALATKPDIKIVDSRYIFQPLTHNEVSADARNAGAAGYVIFTFKDSAGYTATYRTYFDRDEKRTVKFTLPGETSTKGENWSLSVQAE